MKAKTFETGDCWKCGRRSTVTVAMVDGPTVEFCELHFGWFATNAGIHEGPNYAIACRDHSANLLDDIDDPRAKIIEAGETQ
jgi:hypothetical protein